MGEAEQWARKGESLGSRVVSEDVHSLEDGRPEDLALYTDDKDERSGNQQPQGIQGTRAQSQLFQCQLRSQAAPRTYRSVSSPSSGGSVHISR